MKDEKYINNLYNHNIEIDTCLLPNVLQLLIKEMEDDDKIGNWIHYDNIYEVFESKCKSCIIQHLISEEQFNKLLRKYGWYID